MKKLLIIFIFILTSSCNNIDFTYNDNGNLTNPLYQKTNVNISGVSLAYINSYIPVVFGENKDNIYNLEIEIIENKTKSSVEKNQATSNLRYELRFKYTLVLVEQDCATYQKEILSYFTIIPKSEGYNYGTDASLAKKYELVIVDNLSQFISFVSTKDIENCQ
tara:strand:+ start:3473 stop:3961 length:489 start_codon:yes stop_codon:yes gene_type:complete